MRSAVLTTTVLASKLNEISSIERGSIEKTTRQSHLDGARSDPVRCRLRSHPRVVPAAVLVSEVATEAAAAILENVDFMPYTYDTFIWVTTEFVALHRFPEASMHFPARAYLEHPHRHKFFVKAYISVAHDERELEYHEVKDLLDAHIGLWIAGGNFKQEQSCETMARWILDRLIEAYPDRHHYSVSVAEDNENGSVVEARYQPWTEAIPE